MLIRWTTLAAKDFSHICDYTEENLGAAQASDTAKAIYANADSLQNMPNRCRRGRRANTRGGCLLSLSIVWLAMP
jgi:plasmid stabilization system protein ParE